MRCLQDDITNPPSPDRDQRLVVFVPKLKLTAPHALVLAVLVVVVGRAPVVDDGGEVGVLQVVGAVVVTRMVRINEKLQP